MVTALWWKLETPPGLGAAEWLSAAGDVSVWNIRNDGAEITFIRSGTEARPACWRRCSL